MEIYYGLRLMPFCFPFFLFFLSFFFVFVDLVPFEVCSIRFDIDNFRLASIFIFPIFIPFVSIRANIPFVSIFQKNILFISFDSKTVPAFDFE